MKKIGIKLCAVAALSCLASGVTAKEIPAGTIAIGGQTDLRISSGKATAAGTDFDVDAVILKMAALYYAMPNLGIGVLWDYEKIKTSGQGDSSTDTTNSFGATAVYNISINEQTSFLPKMYFAKASLKSDPVDASGTGWGLGADVNYFPSDQVSFDFGVSYESFSLRDDGQNVDFDTSGLAFGVGLTAYLR